MMTRFLCALVLCVANLSPVLAETGRRVALVIGNAAYGQVPSLDNPVNDATDVAAALDRLGFEVERALDVDDREMRRLFRDFAARAENSELSLVYFAGHGIQIDQTNYLIPVNAQMQRGVDVQFEAIPLDLLMQTLAPAEGVKIVLVDACRDNPFAERLRRTEGTRSIGTGLARVDPVGGVLAGGILVGYAAREGTVALDGKGRNSPYAQALLEHLEEPGLEISKLFREVRDRVFELTGGRQEPFTYGALPGRDIFLKTAVVNVGPPSVDEELRADIMAAEHMDTFRGWQLFAARHPDRAFMIETLEATEAAVVRALRETASGVYYRGNPSEIPSEVSIEYERVFGLSRGDVLVIQAFLVRNGYDVGAVDGELGPRSRRALAQYQADNELEATGIVTPMTAVSLGLRLEWWRKAWPISSTLGRRYELDHIERLESDARLHQLFRVYRNSRLIYGFWSGNLYVAVQRRDGTFQIAQDFAEKAGGQLVVISSGEENDFVYEMIKHDGSLWLPSSQFSTSGSKKSYGPAIGLSRDTTSGVWRWADGSALLFSNWNSGQPSSNPREGFAAFEYRPRSGRIFRGEPSPKWSARTFNMRSILIEAE